jgi:hypothetical protein
VASTARRNSCSAHLGSTRLRFYLNSVGFYALAAGDLSMAREYLSKFIKEARAKQDTLNLSIGYLNLALCHGMLGEIELARKAVAGSLVFAENDGVHGRVLDCRVFLGWIAELNGDTAQAEEQFNTADLMELEATGAHLDAGRGAYWAEWLARTGRPDPSYALTTSNSELCKERGWLADVARYDRQLGRLALAAEDSTAAGIHLQEAFSCFRDSDYLIEMAITLVDLAEHARVIGDLKSADRYASEAVTIAAPRGLIPVQSAALSARARIHASQASAGVSPDHLFLGRDAADAGLRLAVRHQLPWHELDALRAHSFLDLTEGIDQGWSAKADALQARLVPEGLNPDPVAGGRGRKSAARSRRRRAR